VNASNSRPVRLLGVGVGVAAVAALVTRFPGPPPADVSRATVQIQDVQVWQR